MKVSGEWVAESSVDFSNTKTIQLGDSKMLKVEILGLDQLNKLDIKQLSKHDHKCDHHYTQSFAKESYQRKKWRSE